MDMLNVGKLSRLCKSLRVLKNKTVQEVADASGVKASAVYAFERGESKDMRILYWYMHQDLELYSELVEGLINEDK